MAMSSHNVVDIFVRMLHITLLVDMIPWKIQTKFKTSFPLSIFLPSCCSCCHSPSPPAASFLLRILGNNYSDLQKI